MHIQQYKHQSQWISLTSLVPMKITYTTKIQRIVLQYSWYMHENVLVKWDSIVKWNIQVHNYNYDTLAPILEH